MTTRVRFAPSPTGKMHIGHLRAAIPNALFAKKTGGRFVVRFEDTDLERNVAEGAQAILDDLAWLGLEPDESIQHGGDFGPYRTMERAERGDYKKAIEQLMDVGMAYECFVSEQELEVMRKLQRARREPPRYDNRHRDLSDEEKQKFRDEGRTPVIRFKLEDGDITFEDIVRGTVTFEAKNLGGDPVIVRSNGVPLFTLGGVVDDINQEITHVIRGEDHVANTAQQVRIFEALGAACPKFAHTPMLLDAEGHKFSKRRGSASVESLREEGFLPEAVVAYMASLGYSEGPELMPLEQLAERYPLEGMGRAAVRFDEEQLVRTNTHFIHQMNFAEVTPYLEKFLSAEAMRNPDLENFWNSVRGNVEKFQDVASLYDVIFAEIEAPALEAEDKDYVAAAVESLPAGPYDGDTWKTWTGALKEKTGRKGKALFMPLRLALTGQSHGPELADLLPLMGEEVVRGRLQAVG